MCVEGERPGRGRREAIALALSPLPARLSPLRGGRNDAMDWGRRWERRARGALWEKKGEPPCWAGRRVGGRERSAGRAQGRWQHQQQQQPGRRRRRLAAAVSARCCEAGPRRAPTTGLRRACQRLGGGPESAVVLTRFLPPLSSVLSSPPQKNPLFLPPFRPPIADILLRSPPPNPPIPTPPGCAAPAGSASAAHIARACSTER